MKLQAEATGDELQAMVDKANGKRLLDAAHGSLSGFGSEILIARWEQRAKDCEKTAEQFRLVMQNHVSSYLEKARAFRDCIEDLHRQMGHESKRQPTENAPGEPLPPERDSQRH